MGLGRIIEFRSRDTKFRVEVAVGRNILKLASGKLINKNSQKCCSSPLNM